MSFVVFSNQLHCIFKLYRKLRSEMGIKLGVACWYFWVTPIVWVNYSGSGANLKSFSRRMWDYCCWMNVRLQLRFSSCPPSCDSSIHNRPVIFRSRVQPGQSGTLCPWSLAAVSHAEWGLALSGWNNYLLGKHVALMDAYVPPKVQYTPLHQCKSPRPRGLMHSRQGCWFFVLILQPGWLFLLFILFFFFLRGTQKIMKNITFLWKQVSYLSMCVTIIHSFFYFDTHLIFRSRTNDQIKIFNLDVQFPMCHHLNHIVKTFCWTRLSWKMQKEWIRNSFKIDIYSEVFWGRVL